MCSADLVQCGSEAVNNIEKKTLVVEVLSRGKQMILVNPAWSSENNVTITFLSK
jgi:hypothetical protein